MDVVRFVLLFLSWLGMCLILYLLIRADSQKDAIKDKSGLHKIYFRAKFGMTGGCVLGLLFWGCAGEFKEIWADNFDSGTLFGLNLGLAAFIILKSADLIKYIKTRFGILGEDDQRLDDLMNSFDSVNRRFGRRKKD